MSFRFGSCGMSNQFLDPRSCDLLLGGLRHGKIGSLPVSLLYFQLEFFLRYAQRDYAADIGTIPHRLREHNLEHSRSRVISEMLPIDADIVFEFDAGSQKSDITFKAYFQHSGFERPPEQRRVILHVLVIETDGLKRSVSLPLQALMVGWGDSIPFRERPPGNCRGQAARRCSDDQSRAGRSNRFS